jgi:hypothetical protein
LSQTQFKKKIPQKLILINFAKIAYNIVKGWSIFSIFRDHQAWLNVLVDDGRLNSITKLEKF